MSDNLQVDTLKAKLAPRAEPALRFELLQGPNLLRGLNFLPGMNISKIETIIWLSPAYFTPPHLPIAFDLDQWLRGDRGESQPLSWNAKSPSNLAYKIKSQAP